MATVEAHYKNVLSDIYSWMLGGYKIQIPKNHQFFEDNGISPGGSGKAIDLGAGCGFQSIPLAELGFSVTAIDLDPQLLDELQTHDLSATVTVQRDNLLNFDRYVDGPVELVVCMTDTLLHLDSEEETSELFDKVLDSLEASGKFVLTFRDLSSPLEDLDRIIPIKQDENTIFTCFLEYEPITVKVHDLVYRFTDSAWVLSKSFYRKLRLSADRVQEQLRNAGFADVTVTVSSGLVTIVAAKSP